MSIRSGRLVLCALAALVVLSCGDDDGGTQVEVEPVATVTVDPSSLDMVVGDEQTLSVTLRDADGDVLTGRTITYRSNDEAVATVDAGVVTATGQGETSVDVTSEGVTASVEVAVALPDFEPTEDTELSGTREYATLEIPQGVTVTAVEDLVLIVEGGAVIAGTLQGDCRAITVEAGGDFTLSGTLDNGCSDDSAEGSPLNIVADGFLDLSGDIVYGGDVEITNDPTLTDEDFEEPTPAGAPPLGQSDFGGTVIVNATPRPARAPAGDPDREMGRGGDGSTWRLSGRGDFDLDPGSNIVGQDGGPGVSMGERGGDGGDAGRLVIRVRGNLRLGGTITLGRGGNGAPGNDAGAAPGESAEAFGGNGGQSGTLNITATGALDLGGVTIDVNQGGDGGEATATGADGDPSEAGGDATAHGGDGGDTPDAQFRGLSTVTGSGSVVGGDGGPGGNAVVTGGKGGDGVEDDPNGGPGGSMEARPGAGGDARGRRPDGSLFGTGGMGGMAVYSGGMGGMGWSDCEEGNLKPGGNGGRGGSASGGPGRGGTGATAGAPGSAVIRTGTGDGGDGGDGQGPGDGGQGGTDNVNRNQGPVTDEDPNFERGDDGAPCAGGEVEVAVTDLSETHVVQETDCPQLLGTFTVTNATTSDGEFQVGSGDALISYRIAGTTSISGQTFSSGISAGQTVVVEVLFNCGEARSVETTMTVEAAAGGSTASGTASVVVDVVGGEDR